MEKQREDATAVAVCEYCGHVRCENCRPDRWPWLADGCCECEKRILREWRAKWLIA